MKKFVIAAFAAVQITAAYAEDHLEPEPSIFTAFGDIWQVGGEDNFRATWLPFFGPGVMIRMFGESDHNRPYAVGLAFDGNQYRVFSEAIEASELHAHQLKIGAAGDRGPDRFREAPILRGFRTTYCETAIESETAQKIMRAWKGVLVETRYYSDDVMVVILDYPPVYNFSSADGQLMAGSVKLPAKDSKPGQLVAIADTMRALCENKDKSLLAPLSTQLDTLLNSLPKPLPPVWHTPKNEKRQQ